MPSRKVSDLRKSTSTSTRATAVLRDAAAMAEFEMLLVTAPDRLARKYVHQVLLLEEL